MYTLATEVNKFKPAVMLGRILPRKMQSLLRGTFFLLFVVGVCFALVGPIFVSSVSPYLWWGIAILSGALWIDQLLTYSYHNSYYYKNLGVKSRQTSSKNYQVTYDLASAILTHPDDVTRAFCESWLGTSALLRTGLEARTIQEFLINPRRFITAEQVILQEGEAMSLIGLGAYLLANDSDFAALFSQAGIRENVFMGALRWVINTHHREKIRECWWKRDNLTTHQGLGREWSYGTAYLLERYSRDIRTTAVFSTLHAHPTFADNKVREIESTLQRSKNANVLIVGEAGVGKIDLVMELDDRIKNGTAATSLLTQHIRVLDTTRIFATHTSKPELEQTLLRLFAEAANAGDMIVVIENLSSFLREAEQLGVFIPELLDEFFATSALHIIATENPDNYHQYLEAKTGLTRRFSEVLIDSPGVEATVQLLEPIALTTEAKQEVMFTYPALVAIASAADRYIVEGVMPDKAVDLMVEVASKATQTKQVVITDDFVYQVVSDKTAIPAGPVSNEERDRLLNLEDILHKKVIGQNAAIKAVARTMRRARAGVQASDKPIGSFLFLGPTGVGKTETAKALAQVFFGSVDKLERFDMSEYSNEHGLVRLIGTDESGGELADCLRKHPYCVVLLDEFEKASRSVHDLFLQILDEGIFTDGRGNKVNARNTIIIATSNAGSDLIRKTVTQRKELPHLDQQIIDHLIETNIFRPELLNRFDSTIVFEPLNTEEQGAVANLMLKELYERVKDQGYQLEVSTELMQLLVEKGYSPEFGAREMQRVLQDIVEEAVAQKILRGEVEPGDTISLGPEDFIDDVL